MDLSVFRRARVWLVILVASLLPACNSYVTTRAAADRAVAAKEQEITAAKAHYDGLLAQVRAQYETKIQEVLGAKDLQIRAAADSFYAQDALFGLIPKPTRSDYVWHDYALEGWASLGNPVPTFKRMKEIQTRLQTQLDETRTSLEQLQKDHDAVVTQNKALAADTAQKETAMVALKTQAEAIAKEKADTVVKLQNDEIKLQQSQVAIETERANNRAAIQAWKTKASVICGLLSLIATAMAVYLPVFRGPSALFAGLCGLAAFAVWYIEPWMIGAAVGCAIIGLLLYMAVKHHREDKASDTLALTLQDLRDKGGAVAEAAKQALADRAAKYVKGPNGGLVAVPDPKLVAHIDSKIAAYDALPAPVAPISTSTTTQPTT